MVTPKLALFASITGPIQKTKYVEGCNTTSKRILQSGRSQGYDLMASSREPNHPPGGKNN